jgi:hypothetical protein
MHISFKIIKFYFTLRCSTCFGKHCVHHQELPTTAHAASGHLLNCKHSICLQIMCGCAIMYNMFYIFVKTGGCMYGEGLLMMSA